MNPRRILKLAQDQGLALQGEMVITKTGADFLVAFVTDVGGTRWVLRLPRREGMAQQIEYERTVLELARKHLRIAVPQWRIATPRLIAYPLMEGQLAITTNSETGDLTWNIDQHSPCYVASLAEVLVAIHGIPTQEAEASGLKSSTPGMVRQAIAGKIELVRHAMGIHPELETRWRKWVDDDRYWPGFSTFVHGDLYAGHILVDEKGTVTGILDWSEGQVGDPSVDFAGHAMLFGEESLRELIRRYEGAGGTVWDRLFEHTLERQSASPLVYAAFALRAGIDEHIDVATKLLQSP